MLSEQLLQLERDSTQMTRELEGLSDQRLLMQERQAAMWTQCAGIMERELLTRRSEYLTEVSC